MFKWSNPDRDSEKEGKGAQGALAHTLARLSGLYRGRNRDTARAARRSNGQRTPDRAPIPFRRPTPKAAQHPFKMNREAQHQAMQLRAAKRGLRYAEQRLERVTGSRYV